MDEARIRNTDTIITGEDLWNIDDVLSKKYECLYCEIDLIPCSYQKDINKKRPYFKHNKGIQHKKECPYNFETKLKSKAKERSISTPEGFPFPYPSRLKFSSPNKIEDNNSPNNPSPSSVRNNDRQANNRQRSKNHHYTASSIRTVVNHYLNFPYDRILPLKIDGVYGTTYENCFCKIKQPFGDQIYRRQEAKKIYYSPCQWKKPEIDNNYFKIYLSRGRWIEENNKKKLVSPFIVNIDFKNWSEGAIDSVKLDYKQARKEVVGNTDKDLVVFFIGEQDTDDPYLFLVNDYRRICFKIITRQ